VALGSEKEGDGAAAWECVRRERHRSAVERNARNIIFYFFWTGAVVVAGWVSICFETFLVGKVTIAVALGSCLNGGWNRGNRVVGGFVGPNGVAG